MTAESLRNTPGSEWECISAIIFNIVLGHYFKGKNGKQTNRASRDLVQSVHLFTSGNVFLLYFLLLFGEKGMMGYLTIHLGQNHYTCDCISWTSSQSLLLPGPEWVSGIAPPCGNWKDGFLFISLFFDLSLGQNELHHFSCCANLALSQWLFVIMPRFSNKKNAFVTCLSYIAPSQYWLW